MGIFDYPDPPPLDEEPDEDELAGVCRVCGCSDEDPCSGGCVWAEPDLCSRCAREGRGDDE